MSETIRPLRDDDSAAAATMHWTQLHGLLTELGPAAVSAFYHAASRLDETVGLVVEADDRVAGVVLGTTEVDGYYRRVARSDPMCGLITAFALLRRPRLWRHLRGAPASGAELIYLAVRPDHHRQGLGRRLVEAFDEAMREREVSGYELSVNADNPAVGFYRGLGFVELARFTEFGLDRLRFGRTLGP